MGGTSFLARSGEVVCWCVGHLYAHRTWKSRRRHATRRIARGSVGTVSTSPVGDGRPPALLDTAGMVLPSPVVDGCPPCRPSVPLSGHHAERSRRPATRSQYPVPGGCLQRLTTLAGYEGAVRSPHASMLWSLLGPPASGSPIVTSHQTPPLDYGTASRKSSQAARMLVLCRTKAVN